MTNMDTQSPGLRCKTCGKPISPKDAMQTPTGYSCKDCIRGREKQFATALWRDLILGPLTGFILSLVGYFIFTFVTGFIGFYGYFLIIIGVPFAGDLVARAVRKVVQKRRSKTLFILTAVFVALGGLSPLLIYLFPLFQHARVEVLGVSLIYPLMYSILITGSVYTRLSGIQLFR
ncbi:MAG: hypothetical protein JXA19_00985 [Anaerolineales bacterium]|nr:hypothetical protein [Anaerolineales bacterium]